MASGTLTEVNLNDQNYAAISGGVQVATQFDPQMLKISYTNNNNPAGSADSKSGSKQKLSNTSAKLSFELLFDTTETGEDVRNITKQLAGIVAPSNAGPGSSATADANKGPKAPDIVASGLRFVWGAFVFIGTLDAMDETLDYFDETGKAMRATVSLSMTSKKFDFSASNGAPGSFGKASAAGAVGTTALASVQVGASLQGMTAGVGASADWKSVAAANGIDNPLRLQAGATINLNARSGS